ncbi:hypothetical protein H0266_18565 [Halobacillus locisalis]|uniref:Uncharacterized protein n=1 Tax=Halobacillus locisalis TaxID=220753 RepID=A0A838CXX5_9BACI|nr:hypothetical protein [Halobacillus locisalis]MBA2176887.1 hypothetical protein [Halobacillus locisalis]
MLIKGTMKMPANVDVGTPTLNEIYNVKDPDNDVHVSAILKEINKAYWLNNDWQEKKQFPVMVLEVTFEIDDKERERKIKLKNRKEEGNITVIDGFKKMKEND